MNTFREDLYVVVPEPAAQQIAGYLVYEVTRRLAPRTPPVLQVRNCWDDPADLVQAWKRVTETDADSDAEERLCGEIGLRRISLLVEVDAEGDSFDDMMMRTLAEIVEAVLARADAAGLPVHYAAGQDAPYFSLAGRVAEA